MDDDENYLKWVKENPLGYVLNTTRPALPNFLILHMASCYAVFGEPSLGNYWTKNCIKVCSPDIKELDTWAQNEAGGKLARCRICNP
jgi:hypothetical protein